jgi:hypothetical protein
MRSLEITKLEKSENGNPKLENGKAMIESSFVRSAEIDAGKPVNCRDAGAFRIM